MKNIATTKIGRFEGLPRRRASRACTRASRGAVRRFSSSETVSPRGPSRRDVAASSATTRTNPRRTSSPSRRDSSRVATRRRRRDTRAEESSRRRFASRAAFSPRNPPTEAPLTSSRLTFPTSPRAIPTSPRAIPTSPLPPPPSPRCPAGRFFSRRRLRRARFDPRAFHRGAARRRPWSDTRTRPNRTSRGRR